MGRRLCRRITLNPVKCLPGLWWYVKDTKLCFSYSGTPDLTLEIWSETTGKREELKRMGPSHGRIAGLQQRPCWVWHKLSTPCTARSERARGRVPRKETGSIGQNSAHPETLRQSDPLNFCYKSPKLTPFHWSGQFDAEENSTYIPNVYLRSQCLPSYNFPCLVSLLVTQSALLLNPNICNLSKLLVNLADICLWVWVSFFCSLIWNL